MLHGRISSMYFIDIGNKEIKTRNLSFFFYFFNVSIVPLFDFCLNETGGILGFRSIITSLNIEVTMVSKRVRPMRR